MIPLALLAVVGMTLIVVRGVILQPVRRIWPTLFGCSQCVGWWVGVGFGTSGVAATGYGIAADVLIIGSSGSFLSLLADAVLLRLLGDPNEEPISSGRSG